jgi:hypothetical protein
MVQQKAGEETQYRTGFNANANALSLPLAVRRKALLSSHRRTTYAPAKHNSGKQIMLHWIVLACLAGGDC